LLLSSAGVSAVERLGIERLTAVTVDVAAGSGVLHLTVDNMAPGDRAMASVDLVNKGTAPLRYALMAAASPASVAAHLRIDVWLPNPGCGPTGQARPPAGSVVLAAQRTVQSTPAAILGDPDTGLQAGDRSIGVGGTDRLCLSVALDRGAPNTVQGQTVTEVLTVLAEHDVEPS
jgi:hypothetical protein